MNLPPIGEGAFLICMMLAVALGAILGFALGYLLKEKRHEKEIAAIIRLTRTVHQEMKRERAPKGPEYAVVRTADGREYRARLPLQPC